MAFLIVAHPDDITAWGVYARLRDDYGPEEVRFVSSEELIMAPHWTHRLEGTAVRTEIRLRDGTWLRSEEVRSVFNRIRYLTVPAFDGSTAANRSYALMEMSALLLSWLAGLSCRVINRPSPIGLGLQRRGLPEWLALAARAGLPTRGYRFTTNPRRFPESRYQPHKRVLDYDGGETTTFVKIPNMTTTLLGEAPPFDYLEATQGELHNVLVLGDKVVGAPGGEFQAELGNLTRLAGCELLEVVFDRAIGSCSESVEHLSWRVCAVNSFPQVDDPDSISAITGLLASRGIEQGTRIDPEEES